MFCQQCGKELQSDDAKFCLKCGTSTSKSTVKPSTEYSYNHNVTNKSGPIWNPNAASNWSLIFTPIFGSYIQALNWRTLGEYGRAKTAMIWFYLSLALVFIHTVVFMAKNTNLGGLLVIYLIIWYFSAGRPQAKYVQEKLGQDYKRRSWGTPLLIGFVIYLGYYLAFTTMILGTESDFQKGLAAYEQNDFTTASVWFEKAAGEGDALAQYNLGSMYYQGQGVIKNYQEALKWFKTAAIQGTAQAQYNLGIMYTNGQGVTQDYQEAVKWYRKAAIQGFAQAQSNLGVMYYNGKGITKNYPEAVKWFKKAADQGHAPAKKVLQELEQQSKSIERKLLGTWEVVQLTLENSDTVNMTMSGSTTYHKNGKYSSHGEITFKFNRLGLNSLEVDPVIDEGEPGEKVIIGHSLVDFDAIRNKYTIHLRAYSKDTGIWSIHGNELTETIEDITGSIFTPLNEFTKSHIKENPDFVAQMQPIKGETSTYKILSISERTMVIKAEKFKITYKKKL